ncbi:hypothetical protein Scep_007308 [Stephania cephalantha]|uniref:Uncharacterized protein n=1 Tax=Stephania cephalantha TaxID=152367 RepID=A0AAP0K9L0_9MAGN
MAETSWKMSNRSNHLQIKKKKGRKVTRRKEPEELEIAAAQKKMSKKGTVRMTCQICHVEGHNKLHHIRGQNKRKKGSNEGVQVDGNYACGVAPLEQPNPITTNETYASTSQPLLARYACGETPHGQHNPITINATNASASQPLPAMPSMMDSSQPIPRISPKSIVKISVVRGRGGRRGGRGVSRTN